MNTKFRTAAPCLLLVATGCATRAELTEVHVQVTNLTANVAQHDRRLDALDVAVGQLEGRIESVWLVVSQHGEQLGSISSSLAELRSSYLDLAGKLEGAISQLHDANAVEEEHYQTLQKGLAYVRGRADALANMSEANRDAVEQVHSDLEFMRTKIRRAVEELLARAGSAPTTFVRCGWWRVRT